MTTLFDQRLLTFWQRFHRPLLLGTLALAVGLTLLLPSQWTGLLRILIGWNVLCWGYLLLLWVLMLSTAAVDIETMARRFDERAMLVLSSFLIAMVLSIAAIVMLLAGQPDPHDPAWLSYRVVAGMTLVGAWLLLPTLFTLHYGHLYYLAKPKRLILDFPDKPELPDYADFAYFSFTIAVASQTADVAVTDGQMRKLVLLQSLLSFVFNSSILGLSINIVAGLIH